jgi:enoyl-CoA hydratase/3-hydroxyacyl-CoA dehydrogenase
MATNVSFNQLAVIGAGTMGSGIAQKMASEGFQVFLVDIDDEKVQRGLDGIRETLNAGVSRGIFDSGKVDEIISRLIGTSDWSQLADVDLVVEAVFEDRGVKQKVFKRLEEVCRPDTIFGTNTSSFSVTEMARDLQHPERFIGLHYFFHPAMNRLVEVVPGKQTSDSVNDVTWALQEQMGKIPISSADAYGFVVNRFFAPWLNEAIRLLEEGVADIPTIEAAAREFFGVGMGPFELMNVTGIPILLHVCNTLSANGPFYAPADLLKKKIEQGDLWNLSGSADQSRFKAVNERLMGATVLIVATLVEEGVSTIEDVDIGARVGLRWPLGPFELINRIGVSKGADSAKAVADAWSLDLPDLLAQQANLGEEFPIRLVNSVIKDGVATVTINRPDAMNALNEKVFDQLSREFKCVANNPEVTGIVIAGTGKAFIAGADIRFFIRNIENNDLQRTYDFTQRGQELLKSIDNCPKPVVARMHGLALGGGLEIALACDHIVASDKALVAFPETGIGIYPGLGGTQRTSRRVGVGIAKYLVLSGQMLSAEEAAKIGLIDAVVPIAELDSAVFTALSKGIVENRQSKSVPEEYQPIAEYFEGNRLDEIVAGNCKAEEFDAQKLAGRLKKKAPIAMAMAEDIIERGADLLLEQGLELELDGLLEIFATSDAYIGLQSIGGKPATFSGR